MKALIATEQLQQGLQVVQNVVGNRTTLPILSHVLLHAENNRLHLTATDLDVTISTSVDANIQRSDVAVRKDPVKGDLTVPVKKMSAITRELGQSDVELEVAKGTLDVRSGASRFKIIGLNAEEFPPVRQLKEGLKITLPQEKLKRLLTLTAYAISTDQSRYVLNGVFFAAEKGALTCVATDGRRLALAREEIEQEDVNGEFIIPTKTVNELRRLIGDAGTVEIVFSTSEASFTLQDESGAPIHLLTKLVEGNFPNYKQVIPSETKHEIKLDREDFLNAMRRAGLLTTERYSSVKLKFTRNSLELSANAPEVGEAHEHVATSFRGNAAVAFNPDYITEPLKALPDETITLQLIDELSPGVIRTNSGFLYVVMPMRLDDPSGQPQEENSQPTNETKGKQNANEPGKSVSEQH